MTQANAESPFTEDDFEGLLRAAPDGIVVVDRSGRMLLVNAELERLFGYERDELLGQPVEVLLPERLRAAHVTHRSAFHGTARVRPMGLGLDLAGRRKNGSEFPLDITLGPVGQDRIFAIVRDMTAHRAAREALRRWEDVFRHARWGVVVCSTNGSLVAVNPAYAAMHGCDARELVGRPLTDMLAPEAHAALESQFATVDARGHYVFETVHTRKDSSTFPVLVDASVARDERGNVLHRIAYVQDITDRRRIEEERARLLRVAETAMVRREELLAVASHDLRSPLSGVLLLLEGFRREALSGKLAPNDVAQGMAQAQDTIKRVLALANDLLEAARAGAGELDLHLEPVDLRGVVADVVERHRAQLTEAGCTLSMRADEPIVGRWDRLRLDQIVGNLVSNAIKYGKGKPVEVALVARESAAVLTVRDHGTGIPQNELSTIFERFRQAAAERRRGSFGLGLWIVKRITETLGGNVTVASKVGEGSVFTVVLPVKG